MAVNERDDRDPRLDRLYREAAQEEPPAYLDAAILAAARREVGARPRSLSTALRRWHVPVSIAAVVVVSVSLVILVREEGGERIGETRIPPVAAPADQTVAEPAQAPPTLFSKVEPQAQFEARAPSMLSQRREDSGRPATLSKLEDTSERERDSAATSSGAGAVAPKPAAEPSPEKVRVSPLRSVQERAAAPASPDTVAAGRLGAVTSEPVEKQAAPAADALSARPLARAMAVKPAGDDRPPVWQGFEKEPPEKWVVRIEELVREGRASEAEAMRVEFKRRFPDHPLAQGAK